jgi:ferredoxin
MKVVINARNGTRDFECAPGEKILLAGLRSGVELPYECGTGTCGTCKAVGRAGARRRVIPGARPALSQGEASS